MLTSMESVGMGANIILTFWRVLNSEQSFKFMRGAIFSIRIFFNLIIGLRAYRISGYNIRI